jgi:hypothetical protein
MAVALLGRDGPVWEETPRTGEHGPLPRSRFTRILRASPRGFGLAPSLHVIQKEHRAINHGRKAQS